MADAAGDTRLRVFFALWPDRNTRSELHACGLALCARHGGRAVVRDNLHLTLAFVGEQPLQRVDELLRLAARIKGRAFTLTLNRAGCWQTPRILWCAPDIVPPALAALNAELGAALQARDFRIESRPYLPHVTLVRKVHAATAVTLPKSLHWQVQSFGLAVSEPRAQGVHYRLIGQWPLQQA
jgi:2'-5' RNA ligase